MVQGFGLRDGEYQHLLGDVYLLLREFPVRLFQIDIGAIFRIE